MCLLYPPPRILIPNVRGKRLDVVAMRRLHARVANEPKPPTLSVRRFVILIPRRSTERLVMVHRLLVVMVSKVACLEMGDYRCWGKKGGTHRTKSHPLLVILLAPAAGGYRARRCFRGT
jgi:hypothetical protein